MSNNKTFATAVLAAVAIVMALASPVPWDGTLMADSSLDGSAAVTAVSSSSSSSSSSIPNTPDAWPIFDTLSDIMSSEWLITPAFAEHTIDNISDRTVQEGAEVTLTITGTGLNANTDYRWYNFGDPDLGIHLEETQSVTFTAPQVNGTVTVTIIYGATNHGAETQLSMALTIQDSVTNTPPVVNITPETQTVTEGATVSIPWTATDVDSDTLTRTWSSDHSPEIIFSNPNTSPTTFTAPDVTAETTITVTLAVNDGTISVTDTMELIVQDSSTVTNTPPVVNITPETQTVTKGATVSIPWTATDVDNDSLTRTWSSDHSPEIIFNNPNTSPTTFTAPDVAAETTITVTLAVNDGTISVTDTMTLIISDPNIPAPPAVDAGSDMTVNERDSVTLTGYANDPNGGPLEYSWSPTSVTGAVITGADTKYLRFTAPGITSNTEFDFTLTVTDPGNLTASDTVTVTVQDVPIQVSYVAYNPGNGQLKITFNQNIESVNYGSIHIRSTGSNSDGILLSDVAAKSSSGRTITVTLSDTQQETYADLQNPQLDIGYGAVTDADSVSIEEALDTAIRTISNKKSSSSTAPIVDLTTLAQARIIDIPQAVAEQVSSHDASDPLESIPHSDTFDLPLAINEHYYLLDDTTNTLMPQTVTAGQSTEIEFTVYTEAELAHFTLYLNLQGNDINYSGSDTYITYTNDGAVSVTDPHDYIADATITIAVNDSSMPEKKTVAITIEFEEPMGSTNMVAYMWNTDRKASFVNLIDAIEVVAPASDEEEDIHDNSNTPTTDSEPETADDSGRDAANDDDGGNTQSDTNSLVANADDDAQTLLLVRMWSGFEPEMISGADLLESLSLDYPKVDIPAWMMNELGVLVSNGDVTVKEFKTALVYMLDILTA